MAERTQPKPPDGQEHQSNRRGTLCISHGRQDVVLQSGDGAFENEVSRFYSLPETVALEKSLEVKSMLRRIKDQNSFWEKATEALGEMTGAQYAFITRRMDFDDDDNRTPLPPIGEPGSCLMGMSILYTNPTGFKQYFNNSKYLAYKSPCAHMRYNKVFLVPERMSEVVPDNQNNLPEPPEGYLAVPLSLIAPGEGESFGHFGIMWTQKGLDERVLSFPFLELLLHGMEDLILEAFVEQNLTGAPQMSVQRAKSPIIKQSERVSHIFKPFAPSLSHELRTPMQGVVGMLDIMYATVQEASEGQVDLRIRQSFHSLRENIEVVQDSARRAVEAADNIVHAYDMNMHVPDAPEHINEDDILHLHPKNRPLISPTASSSPQRGHKRTRSGLEIVPEIPSKFARISSSDLRTSSGTPRTEFVQESSTSTPQLQDGITSTPTEYQHGSGIRSMNVRDALETLVNDMIKVGGRPESAIAHPLENGEEIEVRRRAPDGTTEHVRVVKWTVEEAVPETILVDEKDFSGLVSRVLHNAFKFTEEGHITINIKPSVRGKYILISVKDTGIGIPSTFMPSLFKPFSKEDDGITRQSEGLGLGLMVAKGLARRMNGDLYALNSTTEGPTRGTEFEMRIPLTPNDIVSRSGTPFSSPTPSLRLRSNEGSTDRRFDKTPPMPMDHLHKSTSTRNSSNISPKLTKPNLNSPIILTPSMQVTEKSEFPSMLTPTSDSHQIPSQYASSVHTPTMLQVVPCSIISGANSLMPSKGNLASRLPLSFLVVEDNLLLRRILVQMLHKMGYDRILEAYDGAEAIRQMEAHQRRYLSGDAPYEIDVVLMDLWMPTMNGYETAKHIFIGSGNVPAWKRPVIVAITADVTDGAIERVANSGMRGPLTKPYKQSDLERNLLEFCSPLTG